MLKHIEAQCPPTVTQWTLKDGKKKNKCRNIYIDRHKLTEYNELKRPHWAWYVFTVVIEQTYCYFSIIIILKHCKSTFWMKTSSVGSLNDKRLVSVGRVLWLTPRFFFFPFSFFFNLIIPSVCLCGLESMGKFSSLITGAFWETYKTHFV